jgi:hypothetical protein
MSRMNVCFGLAAALIVATTAQLAAAATISSAPFSLGYGYASGNNPQQGGPGNGYGLWGTSEAGGANTAMTIGDFSFTTTVLGGIDSFAGPTFIGRVVGDDAGNSFSGVALSTHPFNASFAVTGSYDGPVPGDAAGVPNFQVKVEISQISVYANNPSSGQGTFDIFFRETTPGQEADSPGQTITFGSLLLASDYDQLSWDPADVSVAGTSATRSWFIPTPNETSIDAFELLGTVTLTYDQIPEPSGLFLLGMGLIGLLGCRRQK